MKINVTLLNDARKKNGVQISDIANALNIDQSTYYRKIKDGGGSFTIAQVQRMADILKLSACECSQIFFGS